MFDATHLHQSLDHDLESARASATDDPQLEAQRSLGLRLVIEAREDQTLDDVAAALRGIHDGFTVEPLFPAADFAPLEKGEGTVLDHRGFVATLAGLANQDLTDNAFDIARGIQAEGGFARAVPDMPLGGEPNVVGPTEVDAAAAPAAPGDAWALRAMRVKEAWSALRRPPGEGVRIGHPDTGWTQHNEWRAGGLDLTRQRNFVETDDPGNARDRLSEGHPGHGTHTAAVMVCRGGIKEDYSGTTPPGRVTGVAPAALNVPLRAVTNVVIPPGYVEVARALRWSIENKLPVISMSLGGVPLSLHPDIWHRSIDAVRKQHILIAASGNYPDWVEPWLRVTVEPAWWNFVIGVTASTPDDTAAQFSGRPVGVEISAPGQTVLTASGHNSSGYSWGTGTSYATAHVAGVAAVWLSHHFPNGYPQGAPEAVHVFKEHIRRTARAPEGWDTWFGPGIIDAHALVTTSPRQSLATPVAEGRYSHCEALAHQLGIDDPRRVAAVLDALVPSASGDALENDASAGDPSAVEARLEPWLGELRTLLATDPALWQETAEAVRGADTPAVTAEGLRGRLADRASHGLRTRLAAAPAPVPVA